MKARFDGFYWLLSAAQTVAAPLLLLKKWRRFRARGDAYEWDLDRWNCDFKAENQSVLSERNFTKNEAVSAAQNSDSTKNEAANLKRGPHLVLVAMGFAETRLAARLTEILQRENPEIRVTWAIRNLDAARQGGAIPENQAVASFPFDYFAPVNRWISHFAPDAVVFIERFQFPVFARTLHLRGVAVAVVAARSRSHQGGRYRFGAFYARWFLGAFDLICFRSDEERRNLGEVPAATQMRVTGSLKFWPQLPPIEPQRLNDLRTWLQSAGNAPILAAGSTQPGDEAWVLDAFALLRENFGAKLLLAPRHIERADEVEQLCQSRGWKTSRRSQQTEADAGFDGEIFLLDTLGELTHAYGAACAAFVGGTISGTGHNVLEPIAHGIPVFFGPKRGTFAVEQEKCEAVNVGFRVQTAQELAQGWEKVVGDAQWRRQIAVRARQLNQEGIQAWEETIKALLELMASL